MQKKKLMPVLVGVLDTGIDLEHHELQNRLYRNDQEIEGNNIDDDANGFVDDTVGYNFHSDSPKVIDQNGHGTHVAGLIAGDRVGVSTNAILLPIQTFGKNGKGSSLDISRGLLYAMKQKVQIINCSWGGGLAPMGLVAIIKHVLNNGIPIITSAGNDGLNIDNNSHFPSGLLVCSVLRQ